MEKYHKSRIYENICCNIIKTKNDETNIIESKTIEIINKFAIKNRYIFSFL